jgi:hypothetical protein
VRLQSSSTMPKFSGIPCAPLEHFLRYVGLLQAAATTPAMCTGAAASSSATSVAVWTDQRCSLPGVSCKVLLIQAAPPVAVDPHN